MRETGERTPAHRRVPALICLMAVLTLITACSNTSVESAPSATDDGTGTATPTDTTAPMLGDDYTREDVTAMYEEDGGTLRLRLPVTIKDGYSFIGFTLPDTVETAHGEKIIGRKAWFKIGIEIITVCVENLRYEAGICPETNIDVSRTHGNILWNVSVGVPVLSDHETWGDVAYSVDPDDWTWMP